MNSDIRSAIRPSIVMLLLFSVLTGLAYPAVLTGIAQLVFPAQANGSLIRDGDKIVGSELIGQTFAAPKYFHSRPSAAGKTGYDGTSSSGSNLGPTSKALVDRVRADVKAARADGLTGDVPGDLLTTSASGLDPHISPASARVQIPRVAKARGLTEPQVSAIIEAAIEPPLAGILGEPRVNVLLLNRQLDTQGAKPAG